MPLPAPSISQDSLACLSALRNDVVSTSRSLGWSSLLLDHVEGRGESDVHETAPTADVTIVLATAGEHDLWVHSGGRWRSAIYQAGAIGVNGSGTTARLRWRARQTNASFRTAHLYLPCGFIEEAAEQFRRAGQRADVDVTSPLVVRDPGVRQTMTLLLRAMEEGAPDFYAEQAARWLATQILWSQAGWSRDDKRCRTPVVVANARLSRAVEFMDCNYKRQITVSEIAAEVGISPFHFGRLFSRATGRSPFKFLSDVRMSAARRLLRTTDLPIATIAVESGYTSATSFTAAFTARFGSSPKSFRSQLGLAR